jgi:arsenate reductase-like glutaredoxin family protein
MADRIVLWARAGQAESEDAQRFLKQNGYRADVVRDAAREPPTAADLAGLAKALGGDPWPLVDTRHPSYGDVLPRGAEDATPEGVQALLLDNPGLLRTPLLVTPKGAIAGFRERAWARFLGIGPLRG